MRSATAAMAAPITALVRLLPPDAVCAAVAVAVAVAVACASTSAGYVLDRRDQRFHMTRISVSAGIAISRTQVVGSPRDPRVDRPWTNVGSCGTAAAASMARCPGMGT